jgi:hypothetical protein
MDYATHKAMIDALKAGTATPAQQQAIVAYIDRLKSQHSRELREAERDSRDAYHEGRANAAAEARGEPYGTY